jgi:hypothetical protein
MKNIKQWILHYLYGLAASCWNASISAVKISGGLAVASTTGEIPPPDLKVIAGIALAAAFWEAIDYFNDNKLPTKIDLNATPTATP